MKRRKMSKKKRRLAQDNPPPSAGPWLPAVILLTAAIGEITLSAKDPYYFANRAAQIHAATMKILAWLCLGAGALALLFPRVRSRLVNNLDELSRASSWRRRLSLAVACLGATTIVCFVKYCGFRTFQLDPFDTAAMTQMAFNTLHGRWLESTVFSSNALGIHFAFTIALFSPVLALWSNALPLLLLQGIAVGSLGLAVYEIIWELTSSSWPAALGMILCYAHPSFHQLVAAPLDNSVFMAAFFLWGMVFLVKRQLGWCLLFIALAATGREQFPFTLAGLGIYWAVIHRANRQRLGLGIGLMIFAIGLWFAEMRVVNSFSSGLAAGYWAMYSKFGNTSGEVLRFAIAHPLALIGNAFYPASKLWPIAKSLLFVGLTPLAQPASLIPLAVAALPQQLVALPVGKIASEQISNYQHYLLSYAAPTFGPLLFAAAAGLAALYKSMERLGSHREWLLIPVLLVAGLGLSHSSTVLIPNSRLDFYYSAPAILGQIPEQASLWVEETAVGPWVACRPQLKIMSDLGLARWFTDGLFRPQYVIMSKGRLRHVGIPGPIIQFLANNHYVKVADRAPAGIKLDDPVNLYAPPEMRQDLILLKDPTPAPAGGLSPPAVLPNVSDSRALQAYARYLLSG